VAVSIYKTHPFDLPFLVGRRALSPPFDRKKSSTY
jgi:hypothetical protein